MFGDLGAAAVIADVGAGSGVGTQVVADETSARIVALEPNATMRAMLTSRVAGRGRC